MTSPLPINPLQSATMNNTPRSAAILNSTAGYSLDEALEAVKLFSELPSAQSDLGMFTEHATRPGSVVYGAPFFLPIYAN